MHRPCDLRWCGRERRVLTASAGAARVPARGARGIFRQRRRDRDLGRQDTRRAAATRPRRGSPWRRLARGCGWGPGCHAACWSPGLPLREPARRWYDGALALPLAPHAGAGAEPVLAHGHPHATRGGERWAGRLDERSGRRGRERVRAADHVLLPCGLELRRPRRGRARGAPGFPRGRPPAPLLRRRSPVWDSIRGCLQGALALARRRLRAGGARVRPSDAGSLGPWDYLVLRPPGGGRDGRLERRLPGQHPGDGPRLRGRGIRGVLPLDGLRTPLRRQVHGAPGPGHTRPLVRGPRRRRTWHRAGRRATPRRARRLRMRRRRFLHSLPRGPQRRRPHRGYGHGPALAAVSTTAYTGFLAGPPFIGFLAELTGLGQALYLIVALSVAIVVFGGAVKTGGGKPK